MRQKQENKYENVTVEKLAERAKKGDREALVALCQEIAGGILFRTTYFIRNRSDAEDVAQEILIRVCEGIHGLRNSNAFRGWLNTIIKNETRRYMTKNTKSSTVINLDDYLDTDIDDDDDAMLPEDYAINEEDRKAVIAIIDDLPDRQREAIFLHYYEGMSVNDVADTMDVTKSAVSHYIKLAIRKIQSEIEKQSEKTGTMCALSLIPIGGLLANVFRNQATQVPFSSSPWFNTAVGGFEKIGAGGGTLAELAKSLFGKITAAVVSVSIVATGAYYAEEAIKDVINPPSQVATVAAQGQIEFSDKHSRNGEINPIEAKVTVSNERGTLTAKHWWISSFGSEEELFSGSGDNVGNALVEMQEYSENGEYILYFLMEDTLGSAYKVSRPFTIKVSK